MNLTVYSPLVQKMVGVGTLRIVYFHIAKNLKKNSFHHRYMQEQLTRYAVYV